MSKRIVIMAGGTGGHVFPALAVAEELMEKGWQVSWLGTQKGLEGRVIPELGIDMDWLSVSGVRGKGWWGKISAIGLLLKSCLQALRILRHRKPDVVLGMGGFVAGPGGLMAKLLGIPLVIHEQNRVPGTTNRLLAHFANRVLEGFPGSFRKKTNATFTGNPLRKRFIDCQQPAVSLGSGTHILVVGGSQGAQILNEVVPDAFALLRSKLTDGDTLHIRHQTGAAMQGQVEGQYKKFGINAEVNAFIDDMASAYQWADLVVCRSGAMTVSEVAAVGVPAIFIPLPSAIDDHQTANANYLVEPGAGLILLQKELTATTLVAAMTKVLKQLDVMKKTAKKYARLDAATIVAGVCMAEAGQGDSA